MKRTTRLQGAIVQDDHLLLVQHREFAAGREYWLLPGGGAEEGESDEACLAREINEETHLHVAIERLLLDEPAPPGDVYQRFRTYLCRPLGGVARPGAEPEPEIADVYHIADVGWIDLRDESGWASAIRDDPLTYPLLQRLRAALGYA